MKFFVFFVMVLLMQRLLEVVVDKKNERWLKEKGAVAFANNHYKWFFWLHMIFIVSVIIEVSLQFQKGALWINWFFLNFFIVAQLARGWCMSSLGRFWNTKLYVMPNVTLLKKGPYRKLQHPEYIIVFIELLVIPIMFQAYVSAVVYPTLYILIIMLRISEVEKSIGGNFQYKI